MVGRCEKAVARRACYRRARNESPAPDGPMPVEVSVAVSERRKARDSGPSRKPETENLRHALTSCADARGGWHYSPSSAPMETRDSGRAHAYATLRCGRDKLRIVRWLCKKTRARARKKRFEILNNIEFHASSDSGTTLNLLATGKSNNWFWMLCNNKASSDDWKSLV